MFENNLLTAVHNKQERVTSRTATYEGLNTVDHDAIENCIIYNKIIYVLHYKLLSKNEV